jgi:cell fate regulator YaaT (PSP1 superfamily)
VLVEVAFKGNRKEFFNWSQDEAPPVKAAVIVEADRGEDLGYVHAVGELAEKRLRGGVPHAPEDGVTQSVRRLATPEELRQALALRAQDDDARRSAMERVKANGLTMKLSDAEWRWDRRKLTIYFTAEKRVDFRNLVRELASMFRTRIELKQIGVRDEARRLSGIGRCGREYCSASWLPELRPVNLGVARDQRLSLNPTQISGACGRLMCCLRYEHDFYVQQRRKFPKEGKIIETATGPEKVISNDIFRERVTLRNTEGEIRIVALADLRPDWKQAPSGRPGEHLLDEETPALPFEALSDEVLRLQDTSELPVWMPRSDIGAVPRPSRALPVREEPATKTPESRPPQGRDRSAEKTRVSPPDSGGREAARPDGTERGGSKEMAPRAADTTDSSESEEAPGSNAPEEARRGRRRRGRRGGRRSRGQSGGTNGGAGDAPSGGDGE